MAIAASKSSIGFSTTKFLKNGQKAPNGLPQVQYWSNLEATHIGSIPFDACKSNIALSTNYSIPWRSCIRFLCPFLLLLCQNGPKCTPMTPLQGQYWSSKAWNGPCMSYTGSMQAIMPLQQPFVWAQQPIMVFLARFGPFLPHPWDHCKSNIGVGETDAIQKYSLLMSTKGWG